MEDQKNSVAIIGMSLLLPDAISQEEFYENLKSAKDSVTGPSLDRLIYAGIVPAKEYKPGAYLRRIDQFDYKFFRISRKEAEFMEPTQRLVLEQACAAIENAGYAIDDFRNSNTAVYLCSNGMLSMVYQANIEAEHSQPDPTIHTGTLNSMICGRISYTLGLTGPSMMIDSGCSSSVVALNEACDKIINGSIDTALVGGLVLKAAANETGKQGHLGAASKSGKSRAFDAEADGIGTGEGGGILLLKRLDHAIRDKDNIQAVIKGIGVSQDGGRCNSIAAPSPIAQTNTIRMAWKRAGVDPGTVSYIETHGAGTHLGDMIEVQALTDAFGKEYAGKKICALGAVKTNIGHIGNAAGVAGIIKAVISLKKKELFPCLHFKTPNPFIDFDNAPVYVNTAYKPWPAINGHPRRCGVSSFGLSGTNGHVVLEEYTAPVAPETTATQPGLFLKVAAKTPEVLNDYCKSIAAYLERDTNTIQQTLYTLNSGRTDYAYRTGFYAAHKAQLVQQLNGFTTGSLLPVKQQEKAVVMLFSPGTYKQELVEKLYNTNTAFQQTVDKVKASVSYTAGNAAETLAVQLGIHAALVQTGITVKTVIGNGIGRITTQVICGTITAEEALQLISKDEVPATPVDDIKLKKLVKDFMAADQPLLVEAGADNVFFHKINEWKQETEGLEVLACPGDEHADPLLAIFTTIYNKGVRVDWKVMYAGKNYTRVEAPTYPFERTRCWFKDAVDPTESTIRDCFYEQGWQLNTEKQDITPVTGKTFLVFTADHSPAQELVTQLEQTGNTCIRVKLADSFKKLTDTFYEINPDSEEDYQLLHGSVCEKFIPGGIIHLNAYAVPYQLTYDNHAEWVSKTFTAQYLAAKIFADNLASPGFMYAVLASDANKVTDNDSYTAPLHAMSAVLLKSLMAEYPALNATWLDLSYGSSTAGETAALLIKEMSSDSLLRLAAVRNNKRYTPVVRQVPVSTIKPAVFSSEEGVYIVTGGSSGIGLETCRAIANAGSAHFIITGRTNLPPQDMWNSILSAEEGSPSTERIRAMQSLQEMGSSVEYYTAEAGDNASMKKMFEAVKCKYRKVTGIIHAAGLGNSGMLIRQRGYKEMKATLSPKISGSILLEELSRDLSPDYFMSFSSIAVMVPSRGSADYSSANAFEDAWAHTMRQSGKKFLTINWSDWKETGLAYRKRLLRASDVVNEREKVVKGLTNKEGILAIRYAMALDKPQLAVVNTDLSAFAINPFFTIGDAATTTVEPASETTAHTELSENTNGQLKTLNGESLTDAQAKLMLIWHETLKLDKVNLDDDFYDLGGHSLNITQMLNKVKKIFGVSLEMDEMFYNSTIRTLAARIEEHIAKGSVEKFETITPLAEQPYYDISHAQKRFWILSQQAGSEAYNVPAAYLFTGNVDINALENAFRQLIVRHESLRTGFELVDGEPKQRVHPLSSFDFSLGCEDAPELNSDPSAIERLLQKEAAKPFDLERPPLLRVKLFRLAANRYLFFMNLHHIVADATSLAVIRNEVLSIYKSITGEQQATLEQPAIQYKDFAAWQNSQLQGDSLVKYEQYWKTRLQGKAAPVSLPADYRSKDKKSGQSSKCRITIEAENFQALKKIAEQNNTSLFTITLALFNVLLHKYTGQQDLLIGTPVNGRDHNDLEKQVGIYLNTLLLRTTIRETDSFAELLAQVRENTWKDLAHQVYPYDLLREKLGQPHFDIGFTWTVREEIKEATGLPFEIEEVPTGFSMAKNDLWMFGVEFKESLIIEFMYRISVYKDETISLLAERMNTLMAQVIENTSRTIAELHIKTATELEMEQQQEVIEFNF